MEGFEWRVTILGWRGRRISVSGPTSRSTECTWSPQLRERGGQVEPSRFGESWTARSAVRLQLHRAAGGGRRKSCSTARISPTFLHPLDFGDAENRRLDVVFTQHPARFTGTVSDPDGHPVSSAFVVLFSAERAQWQPWSTTSQVLMADAKGAFSVPVPPGRYLVRALSPDAFSSSRARPDYERLARMRSRWSFASVKRKLWRW